jgi:hypothetical protein
LDFLGDDARTDSPSISRKGALSRSFFPALQLHWRRLSSLSAHESAMTADVFFA